MIIATTTTTHFHYPSLRFSILIESTATLTKYINPIKNMFTVYYADCDLNLVVPHTKYKHFNYINVATIIRKKTGSGLHIKNKQRTRKSVF